MGGEYWITDDGSVMFADGDIGDYNHEAHVIQTLQAQFAPDEFNLGEYVDWEAFQKALVAEAQTELQPGQQLEDPADIIYNKLKERGMNDEQINIANGHGDARLFAMKNWGWKRMQGTNIETNTLAPQDISAIQSGVGEVLESEGIDEGQEPTFSIFVMANGLWFRGIPYSSLMEGDIATFREGWGDRRTAKRIKKKIPPKGLQPKEFNPDFDDLGMRLPEGIGQKSLVAWVRANCKFATFGFQYDPTVSERFEQRLKDLKEQAGSATILMLRAPSGNKWIIHPTTYEDHRGWFQVSSLDANGVPTGHDFEPKMADALQSLAVVDGIQIIDKRQGPVMAWVRGNCKFAMPINGDCWVSPDGKIYPADGGHPNWAQYNYKRFGIPFRPTQTLDYVETTDPNEAWMDDEGRIALDAFKDAGWLRIKDGSGIEGYVGPQNINFIKRLYREMAKGQGGGSFYFDDGDGTVHIPINFTGRPDFSQLDARAMKYA